MPGPVIVTVSASLTVHLRVEFPPLATHESAVNEITFGHAGATGTGLTRTTAVRVIVWDEQPLLVTVRV